MLATFGLAGRAAGVHEEEGIFRIHRNRLDNAIAVILDDVVDEIIALKNHRGIGSEAVGIALPDQDFVDVLAFFLGGGHGKIGAGLVVDPTAVTVIAVGIN